MESPKSSDEESRSILSLKEYLIFAPIVGSSLAIAFDVGYFYGLDSGFFSAFSLTEHILFALYATPFAILLLIGGALEVAIMLRIPHNRRPATGQHRGIFRLRHFDIFKIIFTTVALASAILEMVVYENYLFGIAVIAFLVASVIANIVPPLQRDLYVFAFLTPLAGVCLSFSFGALFAQSLIKHAEVDSHIRLSGGRDMAGTFIRSGERGILIYENTSRSFKLVPWTQVTIVENAQR